GSWQAHEATAFEHVGQPEEHPFGPLQNTQPNWSLTSDDMAQLGLSFPKNPTPTHNPHHDLPNVVRSNFNFPLTNNTLGIAIGESSFGDSTIPHAQQAAYYGDHNDNLGNTGVESHMQSFVEQLQDGYIPEFEPEPQVNPPPPPPPSQLPMGRPQTPHMTPASHLVAGSRVATPSLCVQVFTPSRSFSHSVSAPLQTPLRSSPLQLESPLQTTTCLSTPAEFTNSPHTPSCWIGLPGSPYPIPTLSTPARSTSTDLAPAHSTPPQFETGQTGAHLGTQATINDFDPPPCNDYSGVDEELGLGTR
ncbi:hypothetical protein FRC11_000525, partial [Ceratobasidium sp. 423]